MAEEEIKVESAEKTPEPAKPEMRVGSAANRQGDDNVIAALAHALVIFVPILAPLVIWLVYKDKSRYVKYQSFQALAYQVVGSIVVFALWMMAIILSFFVIGIILFPVAFILMAVFVVYGLFAAYKCYEGEDFKYAVIGDWASKHS